MGNYTTANGQYSTAIGASTTASGDFSTAMGSRVSTNSMTGSFIIGDGFTGSTLLSAGDPNAFYARFRNWYYLYSSFNNTIGVRVLPNGTSWSSLSDSTKKERFIAANNEHILNSVAAMRVGTWNYKGDAANRHWGVMAQDFYKHFGKDQYGTIGNDTTIATADFDGVAFAAIKGLEERTRELKVNSEKLKVKSEQLIVKNEKLKVKS